MNYRTRDGDMLDAIALAHYGREDAAPAILDANPGLASRGTRLPANLVIALPDLPAPTEPPTIKLWS